MILMVRDIPAIVGISSLRLFTENTAAELNEANVDFYMQQVSATARNFANRRFRGHDDLFVEECIAEAYFWLVVLFAEFAEDIARQDDTIAYIRMKVAYKLKEYWAPYATSTMSYVKKQGQEIPQTVELDDQQFAVKDTEIDCFICLQSVLRTQLEWEVYEHYLLGKEFDEIAKALGVKSKKVQKVLAKIRKRLKASQNADVPACA